MSDLSTSATTSTPGDGGAWPFPRRFIAVFTSPKALFEHLAERPSWVLPFLVTLLMFVLFYVILWNPVILPETIAKLEARDAANTEQAIQMMTTNGLAITMTTGLIAISGFVFLIALFVWMTGGFILGGKLSYRQALSIVSHAGLVGVPGMAVLIPLALISKTVQVSVGPGMLFPQSQAEGYFGRFVSQVLSSLDVFRLWQNALTALGVSVIGRISRGKANAGIWTVYFVLVLVFCAIGAAFPQ